MKHTIKKKKNQHKRVSADGHIYYYYPKPKKLGRKKKRGPKKKKKETWVRRVFAPWNFKIIICGNKKQIRVINRYHDEIETIAAKEKLISSNNNVLIPIEFKPKNNELNDGRWDLEYLILKKVETDNGESNITKLPNKFGKYVNHKTNNDEWLIWDKFPCKIEETFWVFGYNSISERKDVYWIYENLIENKIDNSYDILRVHLYNNKLIIQDDSKKIEIVVCKNKHDGIRLYNCLKDRFCIKNDNVIFMGIVRRGSEKQKQIIELIKDKTNWTYKSIYRTITKH